MESIRIGRFSADPLGEERGTAASDVANDRSRMPVNAHQPCLDALHFAAAMVELDGDEAIILCSNAAFGRLADPAASHLSVILAETAAFLAADRADHEYDIEEPGVGGRHFRVHLAPLPQTEHHHACALVSIVDRTVEVQTERSLRAEMLHDSLTGLPNRLAFVEAIDARIAAGPAERGFAILAVDLTRFGRINECVGALVGDELIITFARRLVSVLGEGDMLARMAGDEFGVLVDLSTGAEDMLLAARLQAVMAAPIRLSELEIRVDCAIGCAAWSTRSPNATDLLRDAQVALARAKRSGEIEIHRSGDVGESRRRFSLETDLRQAIEADALSLAFQPLIDLETNAVAGFEALTRWDHPDRGIIAPNEFIAIAEESGLIVPLGRWALEAAMRTLVRWDVAAGRTLPLYIAVNVSPVQLARDSVGDAVRGALAAARVGGGRLTIELTESSIVADPARAKSMFDTLKAIDCRIAMDDFGTGYSSLSSLQKLPIDMLKIDRSFIAAMLDDRDSLAIVRAVLGLADALGMTTTAEGIETVETARMLTALGCTIGQGYHFARPLDAGEAIAFYRARLPES